MCRFFTSTHTHAECALQETRLQPTIEPEAGTEAKLTPEPSSFARITRYFHSSPPEAAAAPTEGGPSNNVVSPELKDEEFHCITRKTIIQCCKARNPPRGSDLHQKDQDKRVCADAKEIDDFAATPGEGESEEDGKLTSTMKGICPVCTAIKAAIADSSIIEVILPAEDYLEASQSDDALQVPQKGSKREPRRYHHGKPRPRARETPGASSRETTIGQRAEGRTQGRSTVEDGTHRRVYHSGGTRPGGKGGGDNPCCLCM